MKDLIESIIVKLVDNEEDVEVYEIDGKFSSIIEVKVHKDDVGKVIGKQGRTATSLRTLLKAISKKNNREYQLTIL